MSNKIQFRRSLVTTVVPSLWQLINAWEPFVNLVDERLFISKWDWTMFEVWVWWAWLPLPLYTITNWTTDRSFDADNITLNELANVVATLINDTQEWLVWPTWATWAAWTNWQWVPTWWTAWQILKKVDWTNFNTTWADDIVDGWTF